MYDDNDGLTVISRDGNGAFVTGYSPKTQFCTIVLIVILSIIMISLFQ